MKKYRIKRTYDNYIVQVKFGFWWVNAIPYTSYRYYEKAKAALDRLVAKDKAEDELYKNRSAFKTRYYYPPLSDIKPE